jgi:hypothetical protein
MSGRFLVRLWHCVTVASLERSIAATGLPTMSERPSTTADAPSSDTPVDSSRRRTPAGVHGLKSGLDARDERWPMLYAWKLSGPGVSFGGTRRAESRAGRSGKEARTRRRPFRG